MHHKIYSGLFLFLFFLTGFLHSGASEKEFFNNLRHKFYKGCSFKAQASFYLNKKKIRVFELLHTNGKIKTSLSEEENPFIFLPQIMDRLFCYPMKKINTIHGASHYEFRDPLNNSHYYHVEISMPEYYPTEIKEYAGSILIGSMKYFYTIYNGETTIDKIRYKDFFTGKEYLFILSSYEIIEETKESRANPFQAVWSLVIQLYSEKPAEYTKGLIKVNETSQIIKSFLESGHPESALLEFSLLIPDYPYLLIDPSQYIPEKFFNLSTFREIDKDEQEYVKACLSLIKNDFKSAKTIFEKCLNLTHSSELKDKAGKLRDWSDSLMDFMKRKTMTSEMVVLIGSKTSNDVLTSSGSELNGETKETASNTPDATQDNTGLKAAKQAEIDKLKDELDKYEKRYRRYRRNFRDSGEEEDRLQMGVNRRKVKSIEDEIAKLQEEFDAL